MIDQAPVHDWSGNERGVVAEGVGVCWARRLRIFRYEIRLWRGSADYDRRMGKRLLRAARKRT